ncbi:butyrate kinase [Clostridium saccharoperbutylacetonicum]|uniref:Probable butyrate kinase n=2 Tax=Clostridium TaxID=1485 RepID=M1MGH7_9CLOT|nr:butyrate kinase [Clostridium saccharoperbutylacetonicum]AGF54071.1 butyrate kinase Buk [Clostridium saccharoperbutylacetonicum N1-4(HMT)]NRT59416.1 butyrate kinase [Clostridium saccharoperbutylacetonicum]NSB28607.1 butyrate kinase [Clostridium saccharoperbutylacetonicum]NSB42099.1 butyrate kinase [Clostridium saccharoperbutylacetonicum]
MSYKLLIINPGSTSTKIGVYENEKELFEETLRHTNEEIKRYDTIYDQFGFRKEVILNVLKEKNFDIKTLSAVVGRGGMLKPVEGGTYAVNDAMVEDLKVGVQGPHASNLGGIIAKSIGDELNIPSFIVDPVVTDELAEVARLSGVPELPRKSKFHALNQKAVAKRYGKESGQGYENLNLVVVHMGGGVSVGAHNHGKVVDVNNALDGDGPFSPERAGSVPIGDLIKMCFSGKYSEAEVYGKVVGKGGFVGYLNTNDVKGVIDKMEAGDKECEAIYKAFVYQIAKAIGEMSVVLEGKVDQIIFTGGIAYSPTLVPDLKAKVEWIAPVTVYPGEDELLALAQGAIRVLDGEEKAKVY